MIKDPVQAQILILTLLQKEAIIKGVLLILTFSYSLKRWPPVSHLRLKPAKHFSKGAAFQGADHRTDLSHAHLATPQTISAVHFPGSGLSVQDPPIWPLPFTKRVHNVVAAAIPPFKMCGL